MPVFGDPAQHVPVELRAGDFFLRPITEADTERDYAAVMDTREQLRRWQQSTWPEDDLTLEGNRRDVVDMAERHVAGRAFSYTVLDQTCDTCLGCVYVFPRDASFLTKASIASVGDLDWEDVDAVAYFWVRSARVAAGAAERLFAALRTWFAREWGLGTVLFVTGESFTEQRELFTRGGLTEQFEIREADATGPSLAFAERVFTPRPDVSGTETR